MLRLLQSNQTPMRNTVTTSLLAFTLSLCLMSCGAIESPTLRGEFAGSAVGTTVDSPMASYYVESYLRGVRKKPEWDIVLDTFQLRFGDRIPTSAELAQISRDYSTDLSALILAKQLDRLAERQPLFNMYREELSAIGYDTKSSVGNASLRESNALFLFVPGWLYQADKTTGADFARFRALLTNHGARVAIANTGENETVEKNAMILATQIQEIAASPTQMWAQIVIVSGSKGGPETVLALSILREDRSIQHVAAWVNIGGLLHGTPLADFALTWPVCWLVQIALLPDGSFAGIRSVSVAASQKRYQQLHVPNNILVVNFVGIPLSRQISVQARAGYALLRSYGPNDGITLLTDAIDQSGVTIPVLGADHYFRVADIEAKSLALSRTIVRYLSLGNGQFAVKRKR
jgi:hypothetical protein